MRAARTRLHPGRPPTAHYIDSFADGVEVLKDGTELHLASFSLADAELRLGGADVVAFRRSRPSTLMCLAEPRRPDAGHAAGQRNGTRARDW
jgi:hypothetical protein